MTNIPTILTMDTNGGSNTFAWNGADLFVSGHSIQGTFKLTGGADQSVLLARLFGGTVVSNGNLVESDGRNAVEDSPFFGVNTTDAAVGRTYDVFGGNLNVAGGARDIGDARIAAVVDFGPRFVSGSERIGFDSVADAAKFVDFVQWAAHWGAVDNIL